MDEGNKTSFGAYSRLLIDKTHPLRFQFRQSSLDIIHLNRNMMNSTAAAFLQKLAYRRIIAGRLEQFDPALADLQHRHPDLLLLDNFRVDVFKAKRVAPKLERFVDAFCCDSEMTDLHIICRGPHSVRASHAENVLTSCGLLQPAPRPPNTDRSSFGRSRVRAFPVSRSFRCCSSDRTTAFPAIAPAAATLRSPAAGPHCLRP